MQEIAGTQSESEFVFSTVYWKKGKIIGFYFFLGRFVCGNVLGACVLNDAYSCWKLDINDYHGTCVVSFLV